MILEGDVHLSYCTNIHQGESWKDLKVELENYLPKIKAKVSPHAAFGVGLRLSNISANELLDNSSLNDFKNWLEQEGLYVFTLNGFPFGGFHHTIVKDQVHSPDWTTEQRLSYTLNLFKILAGLIPDKSEAGISTSPISYKPWYQGENYKIDQAFIKASVNLAEVVIFLNNEFNQNGKYLHLDIEPEPDGFLENSKDVLQFYEKYLKTVTAEEICRKTGYSLSEAHKLIFKHITVCYDVCHFALAWEEPRQVLKAFKENGIKVGKIQISAALEAQLTGEVEADTELKNELKAFSESTYLHQVTVLDSENHQYQYSDLPVAFDYLSADHKRQLWRIHFHVPIFVSKYKRLSSTQTEILKVLEILKEDKSYKHLEIETYTWEVLPETLKESLENSISRELIWVLENLEK